MLSHLRLTRENGTVEESIPCAVHNMYLLLKTIDINWKYLI